MFVADYNTFQHYYNPVAIMGPGWMIDRTGEKLLSFSDEQARLRRQVSALYLELWDGLQEELWEGSPKWVPE